MNGSPPVPSANQVIGGFKEYVAYIILFFFALISSLIWFGDQFWHQVVSAPLERRNQLILHKVTPLINNLLKISNCINPTIE
jgi:hypothetical protein